MLKIIKRHFANPNKIPVRDALKQALIEEMKRDKRVFLIGEEVG